MPSFNMQTPLELYVFQMSGVRLRLDIVIDVLKSGAFETDKLRSVELICLQLRKVLELIAFSSLIANKEAYETVHTNFTRHWRVEAMLTNIKQLNPDYYPMALDAPIDTAPGQKHFPRPLDEYLTQEELIQLYNSCSRVLHTPNPYSDRDAVVDFGYTVDEWIKRIQKLLGWHRVQLLDGGLWIVHVPEYGSVQGWPAEATN